MRKKWVMGNWKMNGSTTQANALIQALKKDISGDAVECVVAPPLVYLSAVKSLLADSSILLGAQDLSDHTAGAYTGDVSAEMLADVGCRYVLVGHSERRQYHRENNVMVMDKFKRARDAGLRPVVCLGETLEERQKGLTEQVLEDQYELILAVAERADFAEMILAYEPVWAIGTGQTATPEQVEAVHAFLRKRTAERGKELANQLRIVYGGSVKAANAKALFSLPNVDGGLVGGASLNAAEFTAICQAAR